MYVFQYSEEGDKERNMLISDDLEIEEPLG